MPIIQPANNFLVGLHKQTNETTIGTISDYTFPVYSGRPQPVRSTDRINVTDGAAIQGDAYNKPDEHWECDLVAPAFADALGLQLVGLWPTDTKTGAGPYTHTFSGLGNTPAWMAMYANEFASALQETFEAGLCAGIGFSFDDNGGPLRINYRATGKKPTVANFTSTITDVLSGGYFTASGATLKFEEDNATPVAHTNIISATLNVDRPVTPAITADAVSVASVQMGKVVPDLQMTMFYETMDAYRASYYGAVAGSLPSLTLVLGSVELNFVHTVTGTWSFKLTVPSVALFADPPQPDPGGSGITVTVNGLIQKPGSGDHVQPVLINAVSATY